MRLLVFFLKSLILTLLFLLAEWSFNAFTGGESRLRLHLFLLVPLILALPEAAQWAFLTKRLPLNEITLRIGLHSILVIAFTVIMDDSFFTAVYAFYTLLLLFFSWMLREGKAANLGNLAVSLFSTALMFVVLEFSAPSLQAWIVTQQRAANEAQAAAVPSWAELELAPVDTRATASPVTEVLEEGAGPHWGPLTGWGTRTNARVHRFLPNEFDVLLTYNSVGLRGGEIAYEKPADVFRIMLLGDSFIEAREVNDDETIYAQLNHVLENYRTPDGKRFEVLGAGATGWGTVQTYLYYHVEGYRFSPDIVLNVFVINDVVDNYPALFYPERGIDFRIDDSSVTIISSSDSQPKSNPLVNWLNALPEVLQNSHTVQLLRQVFFPPLTPLTVINNVPQSHPQDYIFLRQPSLDGYPEAWQRTEDVFNLWNRETAANNAQLMVMTVDVGLSYIRGLVDRHIDKPDWIWDSELPYSHLHSILDPLHVPLLSTREAYERYGEENNLLAHTALFLPTDGHWNPAGHRVTAEFLLEQLVAKGIAVEN